MATTTTGSRNGSRAGLRATMPHAVPGRLRVKVQGRTTEVREVLRAVRDGCEGEPGVRSVDTEPRTGSALVVFDPERLDLKSAVELVQNAHEALAEVLPPQMQAAGELEVSVVSQRLTAGLGRADRVVMQATHGVVDLRMAVPIGLAGFGARQVLRYGLQVRSIPWYTLAYYAFDTFVKLRRSPPPGDPRQGATGATGTGV